MKRLIQLTTWGMIVFMGSPVLAQNLVPNPGFEAFSQCPDGRGQVSLAPPWFSPNGGGVDYVNSCAGNNGAGVPTNNWGHQFPLEGKGYAGVRVWRGGGLYREYLAVDLTEPLEAGEKYFLRFFVTPGDSMQYMTDDIGMFISKEPIPELTLLPFQPFIANPQGETINDFVNWKEISGEYTATGGEKHLVIGNFKNEQEITLVLRSESEDLNESAYFFVDKVLVENCKSRLPDSILFVDKKSLCPGETIELKGYESSEVDITYKWSDGSEDSSLNVTEPGEYELEIKVNGCTKKEKINIAAAKGPEIDLGNDTTLCPGTNMTLSLKDFEGTWNWGDGSSEEELLISQPGTYYLEARLENCSTLDSIEVSYETNPPSTSIWDTLICQGAEVQLASSVSGATYIWSDLSNDSVLLVKNPGIYWVDVQTACYIWRKNFMLATEDCGCEIFIPNVITPNGDGINDDFQLQLREGIEAYHLQIFDRWGIKLFESHDPAQHWNGVDKQRNPTAEGVYYWALTYECFKAGIFQPVTQKGYVTVLR